MKSTPVLSDLELALLGLIREQPRSGYALRKAIADFAHLGDSPGAVYPALRRIRAGGLIEAAADATGRKGEGFRVTAAGRRALRTALEPAPSLQESASRQMLRLAFLDLELNSTAIAAFLQACANVAEERAARLRGRRAITARAAAVLAIEHEIEVEASRARWAERTARRLKR